MARELGNQLYTDNNTQQIPITSPHHALGSQPIDHNSNKLILVTIDSP